MDQGIQRLAVPIGTVIMLIEHELFADRALVAIDPVDITGKLLMRQVKGAIGEGDILVGTTGNTLGLRHEQIPCH
jgi:hypothetical protein